MIREIKSKMVFFSYSWQDQAIAMRIFYDLTRSNISVWRDQVDAEKANFNFLDSIFKVINEVEYFLLIDSPNSRNSFFVSEEIQHFLELIKKDKSKKLVICLVGNKENTHQTKELFSGQNYWNFIDFSSIELYDTHKKYNQSISQLIQSLGGDFVPWTNLPDGKDFEDEISAYKISDEDRKSLINDFDTFKLRHLEGHPNLDLRLKILIADCKELGVSSITPYNALGVLYAEEAKKGGNQQKLLEANALFTESTQKFPLDPRAWRGLGGTAFYLEDYKEALAAYNKAIQVTISSQNVNHLKYLNLIKENKAETLLKLHQFEHALFIFLELLKDAKEKYHLNPDHFIDVAFCYLKLDRPYQCETILMEGLQQFPKDAKLLAELGEYYAEVQEYSAAIKFYKLAIKYKSNQIPLMSSLCILLYYHGSSWTFRKYAKKLMRLSPKSTLDYYLVGRVLYFRNRFDKALEYYKKTDGEIGPFYSELI